MSLSAFRQHLLEWKFDDYIRSWASGALIPGSSLSPPLRLTASKFSPLHQNSFITAHRPYWYHFPSPNYCWPRAPGACCRPRCCQNSPPAAEQAAEQILGCSELALWIPMRAHVPLLPVWKYLLVLGATGPSMGAVVDLVLRHHVGMIQLCLIVNYV